MFYKETNFKETPIGKIPKDWEVGKLKSIVILKNGKRPQFFTDGHFPVYGANGIMGYSREYLVDNDFTIVIGRVGASGEIHLGSGRIWISDNAIYSESYDRSKIYLPYLFYLLKSKKLAQFASKTTHPIITQTFLKNFLIQLPQLIEQQKIAEILSTIDKAIQKTNEIIIKTDRLKKGLMQELLTKGIGHKEFKDTEIGKIPKEWGVVRLGEELELCQYGLSVPLSEKGKYSIIRMDEIVNGYVIPTITKYVNLDEETFRAFRLEKGDILFNRTNAPDLVGRTGIFLLEGDYVFASYLIRLRPKREMFDPHFLTFYLIFIHNKLKQLATRAVQQANINATNLKRVKIPKPRLQEQQKIAEILSTIDKKLEFERTEKAKLERIKQGMMDLLLTGKIRVKV